MAKNKLVYNMDSLENIRKSLELCKGYRAQVGIFEDKNERGSESGLTNSEVGARMEFGSTIPDGPFKDSKVPARSFLRMPIRTHIEEIVKAMKSSAMGLISQGKVAQLFMRLGAAGRSTIKTAFVTSGWGSWAPNAPVTIQLKGSDKPLIDTRSLFLSIAWRVKK